MLGLFEGKPDLIVHSREPLNAEPPLNRLASSALTRQRDFYVRTHGTIPQLAADKHRLRISGRVARPLSLTVAELRAQFAPRTVTAVLQCAGNRRADFLPVRPVSGDAWEAGAIGNAVWTGVALGDVLREASAEEGDALHVAFACADEIEKDGGRHRFCVSVPMHKALAPESLLAFAMNNETLAPEHGYPLRAIIPGFAGVRSAKWISAIEVRDRPADGPIQQRDYKLFPADASAETAAWESGLTIDTMPLNAAICEPQAGAHLAPGKQAVRGYAISSGRTVARVDVSADGGRSWRQAALEQDTQSPWSWTLWRTELDLPPGRHQLAVRAFDEAGQTQPALPDDVWNFKGYLCNCWHRVEVTVG